MMMQSLIYHQNAERNKVKKKNFYFGSLDIIKKVKNLGWADYDSCLRLKNETNKKTKVKPSETGVFLRHQTPYIRRCEAMCMC